MAKKRASIPSPPEDIAQPKKAREIVPSRQFEEVAAKKRMVGDLTPPGTVNSPEACPICDICESDFSGGFVFCHEGVPFVMNDHPTTGGPWAPGWFDGSWVWVNVG